MRGLRLYPNTGREFVLDVVFRHQCAPTPHQGANDMTKVHGNELVPSGDGCGRIVITRCQDLLLIYTSSEFSNVTSLLVAPVYHMLKIEVFYLYCYSIPS